MSADLTAAVNFAPPGIAGTQDRVYATAVAAASTAETLVLTAEGGMPAEGCYVTWVANTDCHITVGSTGLGAAAVSTSFFLPAGVVVSWWHYKGVHEYFRVIRATADGFVYRYRSNR